MTSLTSASYLGGVGVKASITALGVGVLTKYWKDFEWTSPAI